MKKSLLFAPFCLLVHLASPTLGQTLTHEILAFSGDATPGVPGAAFSSLEKVAVAPDGRILLQSYLAGPGVQATNNRGLWTSAANSAPSALLARLGANGPSGSVFGSMGDPRIASGGKVGFCVTNSNPNQGSSFLAVGGVAGNLSIVASGGMTAPGASPETFAVLRLAGVSGTGQLGLTGLLDVNYHSGVWRGTAGDLVKVAAPGDAAPGLAGTTFLNAVCHGISPNGTVALVGTLSGSAAFKTSIWKGTPGNLSLVLREGSTVLSGEIVTEIDEPVVNDAGTVVFLATTSTTAKSLWSSSPTGPRRLVSAGQTVPGSSPARTFATFGDLSINASGQIAFYAELSGNPGTAASFWRLDPDGALHRLAQSGQTLPTRSGTGTLTSLVTDSTALADDGSAVFIATSGASHGLYRARLVPAAGPSTPPAPLTAPKVRLPKKIFRTTTARVRLRGTVLSSAPVSHVLYRTSPSKRVLRAVGTTTWRARPAVPKGRSKVFVHALTVDGRASNPVVARVLRTK